MNEKQKTALHQKADEMIGLSEINLHLDAAALAKQILAEAELDAIAFNEALGVILVSCDHLEPFQEMVQAAFDRLPMEDQVKARPKMLDYYHSIKDMKLAANFISEPTSGGEFFFVMRVWLANDRLDEAEKLFFRGKIMLDGTMSDFDWSMLLTALANYCECTGNLNEAEQYWLQASEFDEPILRDALSGLVKIQIVRAWKQFQRGLGQIEKFKTNIYDATVLRLPGNHDILLADARKELEAYREVLEIIVPEKDLAKYSSKP